MTTLLLLQLALAWFFCGVIWVVHLAIYPLFARIGPAEFGAYHAAYMQRIGRILGVLMPLELFLAVIHFCLAITYVAPWLGLALVIVVWVSTAGWQVPLHTRLASGGHDLARIEKLVSSNRWRVAAWTARALLLTAWVWPLF